MASDRMTPWQELLLGYLAIESVGLYVDQDHSLAWFLPWWCLREGVGVRWNQVEPMISAGWISVRSRDGCYAKLTDTGKDALEGMRDSIRPQFTDSEAAS